MPASRRARAMIFAPRSWPSRPGLATTTRIFRLLAADIAAAAYFTTSLILWSEPDVFALELNLAGPRLTDTVCGLSPRNRHTTVVPLETVTVGTPLERT